MGHFTHLHPLTYPYPITAIVCRVAYSLEIKAGAANGCDSARIYLIRLALLLMIRNAPLLSTDQIMCVDNGIICIYSLQRTISIANFYYCCRGRVGRGRKGIVEKGGE